LKVLVTGHDGYIGCVLTRVLEQASHDVVGLDTYLFEPCTFGEWVTPVPANRMDIRDTRVHHLEGFDALVHLAAISNDPMGDLNPALTYNVNFAASLRLARLAKEAGVPRFLFSSSCSLYGAAGEELLDEDAPLQPLTPYGYTKVLAELEIGRLADDGFSPTFLRNATAYGVSPRLRADLVVNNLAGSPTLRATSA
jgi:nucleoside-diphosphate-sugar epimerase